MISFDRFEKLAAGSNTIPLVRSFLADLHTPVSAYLTLRRPGVPSFLFESAESNEKVGRYSFIGSGPTHMVRARGSRVTVSGANGEIEDRESVFGVLKSLSSRFRQAPGIAPGGLTGGLVGYMGYDTVRSLEPVAVPNPPDDQEDDAIFGVFPTIVRFDHRSQIITIIHNVVIDRTRPLRELYESGRQVLEAAELTLKSSPLVPSSFSCDTGAGDDRADASDFCASVVRAKNHIMEGDIFQVVLSRRVHRRYSGDPFPVYRALRMVNPSPYLFYLDFVDTTLIGSSPEVLVRARDGVVEVLPIAGTRRRGSDGPEDEALERELAADTKEMAEHVMLVDLGRNDIGRICTYGSVTVPVFMRVERYSHVMHLVSEVSGRLRDGVHPVDVLAATFPAGTVSGAPKVRAMQIINDTEPVARGAYAGAVGYIGFDGSLDTCIAIRTIVAHNDVARIQTGAGIVADSIPENEYEETVNKGRPLLEALRIASNGMASSDLTDVIGERR